MKDNINSVGAMNKARELVGFFSNSSQAEAILLSKQAEGKAVKCIQDVYTHWWSTYSMCSRLLWLRHYFSIMEIEGSLTCNLDEAQWRVIGDTCKVLEPFMSAQKLLEGENYVTISFIPVLICTIRNGLQAVLDDPSTSNQIKTLVKVMMTAFRKHWESGDNGTVATEHQTTGEKWRPKGIPLLALMALLLDPRFKTGPGLSDEDKAFLWEEIKEEMLILAAVEHNIQQQQQDAINLQQNNYDVEENANNNDIYNIIQQLAAVNHNDDMMQENGEDQQQDYNNNNQCVHAELLLCKREAHIPVKSGNKGKI